MSDDLYDRLIVSEANGSKGLIKVGMVKIDLAKLPSPPRFLRAFLALWYVPSVRQAEIQEDCLHSRRDMRQEESGGSERMLDGLEKVVSDYLGVSR